MVSTAFTAVVNGQKFLINVTFGSHSGASQGGHVSLPCHDPYPLLVVHSHMYF